ncbi:MFS general substrate transporter [Periconia macrospinosa]|uniref:MFS general substrate transporter n=1 Tax=Periconia macrospinosa TaxID=97972 RepID=A0A2V1DUP0_9PLEO|nr:MFS general substrate transporter [Periconia macrospinosa]
MGIYTEDTVIPGTELVHGDGTEKKDYLPHPSTDPSDPLNWSRAWKLTAMGSQWLFAWIAVTGALSLAPMFPLIGKEFHLTNKQLSMLTGITVITLGFANFIIVPLSNMFGRRAISLIFSVLITLTCIWQALATSHQSLLVARAMNGLVCATSETIPVQVIADVFFLHERGLWTGFYFTGYFAGAFLGPVISGSIGGHYGWRSFWWLEVALSAFSILLVALTFPETKYHRNNESSATRGSTTPISQEGNAIVQEATAEKETVTQDAGSEDSEIAPVGQGRPSRHQFMPIRKPDSRWKSFVIRDLWTPVKVFFNPIILWAGLMLAGPADLVLFFNMTESAVFSAPPYLFSPSQVGYTNFAFVVGAVIGLATAGPFSDWIAARATRRNNGVREAEFRLIAILPYMIPCILALILGGVGYQQKWPWAHIIVWGYGFAGLGITTVPTIAIAYAVDSYKPISGEIMVVATVCKNFIGFSYSYWIFDLGLESKAGWVLPAMIIFACVVGPALFGIPLYFGLGKKIRYWTRNSDVHRMEESI